MPEEAKNIKAIGSEIVVSPGMDWFVEWVVCPHCDGVFAVDATYLEQVGGLVHCPMCCREVHIVDESEGERFRYEFRVWLNGYGKDMTDAWLDAVAALTVEPGEVPDYKQVTDVAIGYRMCTVCDGGRTGRSCPNCKGTCVVDEE